MKKLSRLSLAIMIELGFTASLISAGAVAAEATREPAIDSSPSETLHDDTMMVTAAEQTLQAPGVSTITADEIKKTSTRTRCRRNYSHHAWRQSDR